MVRFPAADGDNLTLFGDGGVKFKDIGLNGVRNAVNLFWVGPQAGGKGFPETGGVGGFYSNSREQLKSAGQASLDPWGGEDGGKGVEK